jgi:hypothetical protein
MGFLFILSSLIIPLTATCSNIIKVLLVGKPMESRQQTNQKQQEDAPVAVRTRRALLRKKGCCCL